ncbi:MAG: hypothetical protein COB93_03425 [Sneathiella sp.]|nr:MAG: hypothetical protein COB93_03425 [Sneathiella sp.]
MSSSSAGYCSQKSLGELKIRSKILVKSANGGDPDAQAMLRLSLKSEPPYQHKDGLQFIAQKAGFRDWRHAAHVLSGEAEIGEDMGTLWYDRKCGGLLNIWCRNYEEARGEFEGHPDAYLLPYKTQFVIGDEDFMRALGLLAQGRPQRPSSARDLVSSYGSEAWDNLTFSRLQTALGPTGYHARHC